MYFTLISNFVIIVSVIIDNFTEINKWIPIKTEMLDSLSAGTIETQANFSFRQSIYFSKCGGSSPVYLSVFVHQN